MLGQILAGNASWPTTQSAVSGYFRAPGPPKADSKQSYQSLRVYQPTLGGAERLISSS